MGERGEDGAESCGEGSLARGREAGEGDFGMLGSVSISLLWV